jgi:hypothetical protein
MISIFCIKFLEIQYNHVFLRENYKKFHNFCKKLLLLCNFKCGLDLCIDYINRDLNIVEPVVHIEWDFTNLNDLQDAIMSVERLIYKNEWLDTIPTILQFNKMARKNKLDAFTQADVRSMIIFGDKSYKLIPTI